MSYLAASSIFMATASAEPTSTDPVYLYCRNTVPQKAIKGCDRGKVSEDNITQARNVASYQCKKEPIKDSKKANCITKKAKEFIGEAAKSSPKPDSRASFTKALDKVFKKEGGNQLEPSPDSKQNANDTTLDASNCDPDSGVCKTGNSICKEGVCQDPAADPDLDCAKKGCDLIKKYVNPLINLLSLSFGLIAVISIIMGGIQYSASGGDPQKVTQAKQRISKTIFAIVAYFFLYAFLQFIVPGGIFK